MRALELAEELGDTETAVYALSPSRHGEGDLETLESAFERASRAGLTTRAGRLYDLLAVVAVESHRHEEATRYIDVGLAYCSERGLELFRLYLLADRARSSWRRGAGRMPPIPPRSCFASIAPRRCRAFSRWSCSGSSARAAATPVSRRCSTRRGGSRRRPGSCRVSRPVAAASAEAAWLEGDRAAVDAATGEALALAVRSVVRAGSIGELACWRWRAGIEEEVSGAAAAVRARSSPATGGAPPNSGATSAAPTRRRSPLPTRTRKRRSGRRWTVLQRWALGRRRRSSARRLRERGAAASRAGRGRGPSRTRGPDAARGRGARADGRGASNAEIARPLRALGTDGRPPRVGDSSASSGFERAARRERARSASGSSNKMVVGRETWVLPPMRRIAGCRLR